MTTHHHPTDATLGALASGSLDRGRALVVAAHMEVCPRCARWVAALRNVGGAMLEDMAPVAMRPDALGRALAALEQLPPEPSLPASIPAAPSADEVMLGVPLPRALAGCRLGAWEWIGPGIHRRVVETGSETEADARVFLLRAAPKTRMPHHTHTGTELTLVLRGAFAHEGGNYRPGDCEEADEDTDHQPIVQPGEVCLCLVAMQGNLKLSGVFGRLLQPFVRI